MDKENLEKLSIKELKELCENGNCHNCPFNELNESVCPIDQLIYEFYWKNRKKS